MSCYLCKFPLEGNPLKILIQNGAILSICNKCRSDIYLNGIRLEVDIMVVPITEESFEFTLKNLTYIKPSKYVAKNPKFIAFYRLGDISAVSHIAKVINIENGVSQEHLKNIFKINNLGKWTEENNFIIYKFENILELKNKIVRNGSQPIQNRVYKSFKKFHNAKRLSDL